MKEKSFCPYDFREFDIKDLAYELTFPKGWSWESVLEKTEIGELDLDNTDYFDENDNRRADRLGISNTEKILILMEDMGENNGLSYVKEGLKKLETKHKASLDMEDEENKVKKSEAIYKKRKILEPEEDENDGSYTFRNGNKEIIMYAKPCCPFCHNRLPKGWFGADDFAGISLLAPTGGGKTTFMYSLMHENWSVLADLDELDGEALEIISAHSENDPKDVNYYRQMEAANKLCRTKGTTPDHTDRDLWIPPVFLNVTYKGHSMIIGIYDNAGENLEIMNTDDNPNLKLLNHRFAFADMFLFEPKYMNINLPDVEEEKVLLELKRGFKLKTIASQGEYQSDNSQKVIFAKDILAVGREEENDFSEAKLLQVYKSLSRIRTQAGMKKRMAEDMFFCGVMIKSDLLQRVEEIGNSPAYDALFDRNNNMSMLNYNSMRSRDDLVRSLIKDNRLFGDYEMSKFDDAYGNSTSWHCISALGCKCINEGDTKRLSGKYEPIRVAEPLISCIVARIRKNGWI